MFELRTLESDAPETGVRLAQQRLWRLTMHLTVAFATAAGFGAVSAPRPRPPVREERVRQFGGASGKHIWCDHRTGQCGVHDRFHRPVPPTPPVATPPAPGIPIS